MGPTLPKSEKAPTLPEVFPHFSDLFHCSRVVRFCPIKQKDEDFTRIKCAPTMVFGGLNAALSNKTKKIPRAGSTFKVNFGQEI